MKEVGDFGELQTAVKNIPVFKSVEDLRTKYTTAQGEYKSALAGYNRAKETADNTPETITTTTSTTSIVSDKIGVYKPFIDAIAGKNIADEDKDLELYYGFQFVGIADCNIIFAISKAVKDMVDEEYPGDIDWHLDPIKPNEMYYNRGKNPSFNKDLLYFKLGDDTYDVSYGRLYYMKDDGTLGEGEDITNTKKNVVDAFTATWNATEIEQEKTSTTTTTTSNEANYNAAQSALRLATTELYTKEQARNDARDNFNTEAENIAEKKDNKLQYDKDSLVICEKQYKTINITADFSASSIVADEWPAGYTLNGNGHIIETTSALFKTNNGEIDGLATPNGRIATDNNGKVTNSLTLWGKEYHAYDDVAKQTIRTSAADAIYEMRDVSTFLFGYDIQAKEVQKLDDNNKLYQAQYTNADHKEKGIYIFKFNIQNKALKYDVAKLKAQFDGADITYENAILYIDNSDARTKLEEDMENVAIMENGVYTCNKTVLKEGSSIKEFYIPQDFNSTNLTYTRNFNKKVAAVCFPFALTEALKKTLGIENTFQFNDVNEDTGVMWFTRLTSVAANKPCLVSFTEENGGGQIFETENAKSAVIAFKAIKDGDMVLTTKDGNFYGNYASKTPADLLGGSSTDALYGIQNGWLVKTDANSGSRLQQFRSYVVRPNTVSANEAPSYKIGFMDEDGNELSTAIETVSGEIISGFKAKGSDNAIEITTDKACPVKVYALNGALVKSTRVGAGTTSLPIKAGIYVVNGAKVIVK